MARFQRAVTRNIQEAQLQLSGDQFKYRGLVIPTIQIKAAVADAKAELQTCRITVNQNDFIDVTGNVGIAAPFVYQARGEISAARSWGL